MSNSGTPSQTNSALQLSSMSVTQLASQLQLRGAAAICVSTAVAFFIAGMWNDVFKDLADIVVPHKNPKDPPAKQMAFNAAVSLAVTVIGVFVIYFVFKAASVKV